MAALKKQFGGHTQDENYDQALSFLDPKKRWLCVVPPRAQSSRAKKRKRKSKGSKKERTGRPGRDRVGFFLKPEDHIGRPPIGTEGNDLRRVRRRHLAGERTRSSFCPWRCADRTSSACTTFACHNHDAAPPPPHADATRALESTHCRPVESNAAASAPRAHGGGISLVFMMPGGRHGKILVNSGLISVGGGLFFFR